MMSAFGGNWEELGPTAVGNLHEEAKAVYAQETSRKTTKSKESEKPEKMLDTCLRS
jgi:hypothetical protein